MGTRRYTITQGQRAQDVVEASGSAIATNTVQLNVDFNANFTKGDMILALRELEDRIMETNWPPAAP